MDYLTICLADELPAIGCGHRHVLVLALDERHATLLEPSSGVVATMGRESGPKYHGFDELTRGHVRLPYDPERMVQRISANAVANGCWNADARAACLALGAQAHELPPLAGEQAGAPVAPVGPEDVDASEGRVPGEGVGHFVERQIMARREPKRVVALAQANFAGCKVDLSHVKWYTGKLKKRLGAENVPVWGKEFYK